MIRFACVLHFKKCCSNWTLYSKKTALFAVFQCDFNANEATSSELANDAFYICITWKYAVFQWKNGVFCCISMRYWCQFITSSERANDAFYTCITWKYDVFQWKQVLFKLNTFFEKNGVICCISMRFWCQFINIIGTREWCVLHVYYIKIPCISVKKVLFKLNTFSEKNGFFCCILMRFWCQFINIIGKREWCVLHVYYMKISCISWKKDVQIEHPRVE